MKIRLAILLLASLCLAFACSNPSENQQEPTADLTLYFGGDIITMQGDEPVYVKAVVVHDGKIVFTGSKEEATDGYPSAKMMDLQGLTMLPGFIDAHGHAWLTGFQALSANLLPPPDGEVGDIESLVSVVRSWQSENQAAIDKVGWLIGFGYDDAQLKELRHPTAEDLDAISTEYPVLVIHQSGHLGAMNHKALEMSGITEGTPDPPGGIIRRKAGSAKPNGVLEEMALFGPVFQLMNLLDKQANEKVAHAGLAAYASFGYTTAQEGRASAAQCETWRDLGGRNELIMDVAAYPDIQAQFDYIREVGVSADYHQNFRVAGIKISLDGSPQGKTAWLTQPYKVPPQGESEDYKGYPAFPNEEDVMALIDSAFQHNWQVLAHCNGDAAADQFIRAVSAAAARHGNNDRRTVMIHAQTLREDQLDSMKQLGIIPSFFGMHTFYWGDWHRDETLGKERAYRISPAQSALRRDMIFTQHHDAPVALPSSIMIIHSVVNRTSRSGDVIGAEQRISVYQALKSITEWAAYQHFEESSKGTIEVGKLADFVVLNQNPLKIPAEDLMDIQVMETIKRGKTIYKHQ